MFFRVIGITLGLVAHTSLSAGELRSGPPSEESTISPGTPLVVTVPARSEIRLRSVLISVKEPGRIAPGMAIAASIRPMTEQAGAGWTMTKALHLGDPDVIWTIRQPKNASLRISIAPPSSPDATGRKAEPCASPSGSLI